MDSIEAFTRLIEFAEKNVKRKSAIAAVIGAVAIHELSGCWHPDDAKEFRDIVSAGWGNRLDKLEKKFGLV